MTWICSKKVNHQRFQSFEREEIGYGFLNKGKEYIYTHTHTYIHTHIKARVLSHIQLFVTPWTVAHQGPLSMGLSQQEHWSGLLFALPGDLRDLGIEPASPALAGRFFTTELHGKPFLQDLTSF